MDYRLKPKRKKADNVYTGALIGLLCPVIGLVVFYFAFFYPGMSMSNFWDSLFINQTASGALALALIMNLIAFFINIWTNRYETARGIVGMTIFYGIIVIIFKFA